MRKLHKFIALLLAITLAFGINVNVSAADDETEAVSYSLYTVRKGDTLKKIAQNELGDSARFMEIYRLNKDIISNPDLILIGQKLKLPVIADISDEQAAEETEVQEPGVTETAAIGKVYPGTAATAAGDRVEGFMVAQISEFPLLNATVIRYEHEKTGAQVMYIANEDTNRVFDITFKTPAEDDSGVPHVFEHSTLNGSVKYPSATLFNNLSSQTYNTYMNASTYSNMTSFPVASLSEAQLLKYADYYTDSCFNPLLTNDGEAIFREEAWRYSMDSLDDDLTIEGTVYSEMQGAHTISSDALLSMYKTLYPGSNCGNESGGHPDHIPELTLDTLCEYHDKYYHPSNSLSFIYGKYENADAFLALLNDYFTPYEKKEIIISDSDYTPASGDLVKVNEFGLEAGADTANGSYIYYGFACDAETTDEISKLSFLATLINDNSSVFSQKMKEQLPYAYSTCEVDFSTPGCCLIFAAAGVNEADAEVFRNIVDESLAEIAADNFDMDAIDAIVAASKLDILLISETSDLGVSVIPNIAYFWAATDDIYGYMDYIEAYNNFKTYAENGSLISILKEKVLNGDVATALVTTVPVAGLKDEHDAALAAKLAEIKAGMSKKELKQIVKQTAALALEDTTDNSSYLRDLTAVTVESLPEEARIYDFTDNTDNNGVRHINISANVDGIGEAAILLDAGGLTQEQIQYFKLYTDLIGSLDTKKYTRAQLSSKITRYLYSPSIAPSLLSFNSFEEQYHPYLKIDFTAMDEDLKSAYNLIYEIIYNTRLSDLTQIKGEVTALKTSVKNSINTEAYAAQIYRAASSDDEAYGYYSLTHYFGYYDFLCRVEEMLETNPDEVIGELKAIRSYLKNATNAITGFVGNKTSIKKNSKYADKFINRLGFKDISEQTYEFDVPAASEGIIIDGAVQYNMIYASLADLGLSSYNADLDAITAYVNDAYLYPMLRDRYGVYGILHGMLETGMYIVSYRDPNITETYSVYAALPELVKSLENVDQETLDGYILSNYSRYALTSGELTGGANALYNIIGGFDQQYIIDYMKALKSITPEAAAKYAELYTRLIQNGIISTAGSASAINANAGCFEVILNPFAVVDTSKVEFKDISADDSAYEAIRFAFENGYMTALSDDSFGPDEDVTLGELASAFYIMIGGNYDPETAIAFFASYGVLPYASPEDTLTREDLVICTYYFCYALGIEYPEAALSDFPLENLERAEENASRADLAAIILGLNE